VSVADIQAARRLAASQAALCPQKHMQGVTEKTTTTGLSSSTHTRGVTEKQPQRFYFHNKFNGNFNNYLTDDQ